MFTVQECLGGAATNGMSNLASPADLDMAQDTRHLCRISLTCGMLAPSSGSSRSRRRGLSEIA